MARDLRLSLVVEAVDRATRPIRRIQRAVDRLSRRTGLDRVAHRLRGVGNAVAAAGSAAKASALLYASAVGGVAGSTLLITDSYADFADTLRKQSERIGLSIEDLQMLRHAFELGGSSAENTDRSLLYFHRRIGEASRGSGEAAKLFEDMGVSIFDLQGDIRPTKDILLDVADAMAAQDDPAKTAYAAQMLFGRGGIYMSNSLNDGAAAIVSAGEEMHNLGLITDEEAQKSEAYNDEKLRLKRTIMGLRDAIAVQYIPALTESIIALRNWISEYKPEIIEEYTKVTNNFGKAYEFVTEKIGDAIDGIASFTDSVGELDPTIAAVIDWFGNWADQIGLVTLALGLVTAAIFSQVLVAIAALFKPLALLGLALIRTAVKFVILGVAMFANPIGLLVLAIAAGAVLVWYFWDDIVAAFKWAWDWLKASTLGQAVQAIADGIANVLKALDGDTGPLWDGIVGIFAGASARLLNLPIVSAVRAVVNGVKSALRFFSTDSDTAWEQILGVFERAKARMTGFADSLKTRWETALRTAIGFYNKIVKYIPGLAPIALPARDQSDDDVRRRLSPGFPGGQAGSPFGDVSQHLQQTQIGGRVVVEFENMPGDARVKSVTTANPKVPVQVDTGVMLSDLMMVSP